jgi:two-component system sensor histidine kinase MtrB
VVGNLISNACSHGGGDVEVRVRDLGDRAIVEVADRGPGIAPEELTKIFNRFQKGTHSHQKGSGLGLAIASENARVMGADITVTSEAGAGSVFSVGMPRLPRVETIDGTVISR